ncbi:ribosomal protein L7/L12 [Streptomyces sp. NPDC093105]|uniref:ribosomal protein L7/L12 n=1 Tax=Streptomyces sp. NPDC093105 TaxID=3366029 RepID=UPI0037F18851
MDEGYETEYVTLVCDDPAFDVVLLDCGPREMDVVHAVRQVTGLSLWHSRVLTRQAPLTILDTWPEDVADEAVAVLRSAGARAEARQRPESDESAAPSP